MEQYSYKRNNMDERDIKINLSGLDKLLENLTIKDKQTEFDFDYTPVMANAATISTAANGNIWPYVTTGTGNYTLTTGTGTDNITSGLGLSFNDYWDNIGTKANLHVKGDAEFEGDIKLKGKSLADTLDSIENRLAILRPNKELEDKWERLKKLGDMYRALEKDIIEKEKIWDTLKK